MNTEQSYSPPCLFQHGRKVGMIRFKVEGKTPFQATRDERKRAKQGCCLKTLITMLFAR